MREEDLTRPYFHKSIFVSIANTTRDLMSKQIKQISSHFKWCHRMVDTKETSETMEMLGEVEVKEEVEVKAEEINTEVTPSPKKRTKRNQEKEEVVVLLKTPVLQYRHFYNKL